MKYPLKEYVRSLLSRNFWRYFWREFKTQFPAKLKQDFLSYRFANFAIALCFVLCVRDAVEHAYWKFVVDAILGAVWIYNRGCAIERKKAEQPPTEEERKKWS